MQLKEMGERKIAELLIPKFCLGVGDDCCFMTVGAVDLVVTTDPVPLPAASAIAHDDDLYWAGLLLVTINASDLAAAGANPLIFVAAVECPPEMQTAELERFLLGVADGCAKAGLAYSGGNLKEAKSFSATGTATGSVPTGGGLHRRGAANGDVIFSVGLGGEFWRDAFQWRANKRFDKGSSKLFAPESQIRHMAALRDAVPIRCSMDNSDGLLSTLEQLSRVNQCRALLYLDALQVQGTNLSRLEQARLWLGWGDWNVIIAVAQRDEGLLEKTAFECGIPIRRIGMFDSGDPEVMLISGSQMITAPRLESERFVRDSWFLEGIEEYIRRLLALPLT